MSDNASTPEQKIEGEFLFLITRLLLITGVIGCMQYFVIGIIGAIRGYSIQSYLPSSIMCLGIVALSAFCALRSQSLARWKQNVLWTIALSPFFCSYIIGIQQDKYYQKGEEYYAHGQYAESLQNFREVTETWYLRLTYNWREAYALTQMAEAYCQLENFDKAREIYLLVQQRYSKFYRYNAESKINALNRGLQKVKEYEALPVDKKNDISVLYDLALAYKYDLLCNVKALDIYMKILSLPGGDRSKELAKKEISELTTKENK